LDLVKISGDSDAAQYLVTVIKHRLEHSYYDVETAEASARLIDGGGSMLYLFTAAARSAVCSGQFDVARRVYEAMSEEQFEEIDRRFMFQMDEIEERFLREQQIREAEAKTDVLPRVKLKTSEGDIIVELFVNEAPSTVANFLNLVEDGFYDGVDFHQVIDNLLALTGDPSGVGDGHSGKFLIDEHQRPNARDALRGSLVMAKLPKGKESVEFYPNTASSQFAILMVPLVGMEKQQTVFGRVIEGMNVISALRRVDPSKEKKKGEIRLPSDYVMEATVIRKPKEIPEPKYVSDAAVTGANLR
jgi:peptidylprolyl isomerase